MADLPIPDDSGALTADWMGSALEASASGCRLQEVAIETLSGGEISEVVRCRLIWDDRAADAPVPESVIVKLPSPDLKARRTAKRVGLYKRECEFYRNLGKDAPIRSPALLYGDYEAKSDRFVLVLEDLCGMERADQIVGADAAQTERSIRAAARLHGHFWERVDRPSLSCFQWNKLRPGLYRPVMRIVFLASYARALERFGDALPEDRRRLAVAYGPRITGLIRYGAIGPQTFTHGDFRADNLLFGTSGDDVAAVDWQVSRLGSGLYDVAYFLVGSVPVEVRRAMERDILKEYHSIVRSIAGERASGFTFEECWRLHRKYVVQSFIINAVVLGRWPFGSARSRRLAEVVLERSLAAAEDLEAEGFLPMGGRRWGFANAFSALCRAGYKIFGVRR